MEEKDRIALPTQLQEPFGIDKRCQPDEREAIHRLINGEPITVYHRLANPHHFNDIYNQGFRGNYAVIDHLTKKPLLRPDGNKYYITSFNITCPPGLTDQFITLDINTNEGNRLRIHPPISDIELRDKRVQLVQEGYHGIVRTAGVFVPLGRYYELAIFDGINLAGKIRPALARITENNQ